MLRMGGGNISPVEIELRLRDMDEIANASFVAYPDQRLTEVPVTFAIIKPGQVLNRGDYSLSHERPHRQF